MALRVTCSIALLVTLVLCQAALGRISGRRRARDVAFAKRDWSAESEENEVYYTGKLPYHPGGGSYDMDGPTTVYYTESKEQKERRDYDEEAGPLTDIEAQQRLMRHVYENTYDRESNPLTNGQKVSVGINYICGRLNEQEHVLKSRVWQRMTWRDSRVQWDPARFNGISEVRIPSWYIWTPDLLLQNGVEPVEYEWVNAVIDSTGQIWWVPPVTYTTVCRPDRAGHAHHCSLQLGSWTYDAVQLPIDVYGDGLQTNLYDRDCPYVVSQSHASIASAKYECCENAFQTLNVTFTIQKNDYHY